MAKLEIRDTGATDLFDVVVEADFATPLNPNEMGEVMPLVTELVTSHLAHRLFEGFGAVEANNHMVKVRFRYSRKRGDPADFEAGEDEVSRRRREFLYFIFAQIDRRFHLGDTPFPAHFREFGELKDYPPS